MPRKTNVVMIIVDLTWSNNVDSEASSPPHQLYEKSSPVKANATTTMNSRIGTSLAKVTMRLIAAASFTPRAMRKWNSQMAADESTTASAVSPWPSPGKAAEIVAMMNTQ